MPRTALKVVSFVKNASNRRLVIRAELADVKPVIWRRLEILPELRLDQVHSVLQVSFEWDDSHLHAFEIPGRSKRAPALRRFVMDMREDQRPDIDVEPETGTTIGELLTKRGDKLHYFYDFGDSWEVILKFEKVIDVDENSPLARCVAGERAAPPDDSGGSWKYEWATTVSQNPSDPDYDYALEHMEWMAEMMGLDEWDPEAFDLQTVDNNVRATV